MKTLRLLILLFVCLPAFAQLPISVRSTNGTAALLTIQGDINVVTNANYPPTNGLTLPNLYFFNVGTSGSMYGNPTHGPASGQQEWEINAANRLQIGWGTSFQHRDVLQIGLGYQAYPLQQGPASPAYFEPDNWATSSTNQTGYSYMLDFHGTYWDGTTNYIVTINGWRAENKDTNGTVAFMPYSVTLENSLIGQSPGTVMGEEIWSNGTVHHGKATEDVSNPSPAGTNYGINYDGPKRVVFQIPGVALNLTNVPVAYARTNQSDTIELTLLNSFANTPLSTPTNWIWLSESANIATAPTNLSPSTITKISVESDVYSGTTNYFAHASFDTNQSASFDTNAAAFFAAASISDAPTMVAINNLVVQLKAASLWSQWDAIYPMVGNTPAQMAINLANTNNYKITWTAGASTFIQSNGWTSDGAASFGDTGFNPATAISPNYTLNSATMLVYNGTSTFSGSFPQEFMGASGAGGGRACILMNTATGYGTDGFNNANGNATTVASVIPVKGIMATSRTSSTQTTSYAGTTINAGDTSASTAVPSANLYIGARNNAPAANFIPASFRLVMIGGGISQSQELALSNIVTVFSSTIASIITTPVTNNATQGNFGSINVTNNVVVGAPTNTPSFTLVNTNWISGQLYTNLTGRTIHVICPCQITMTGVAGAANFSLVSAGNTTNTLAESTLITSLATSLTNSVHGYIAAGGVFTFTNLSTGTGDSGGPVNGGQYMSF